MPIYVCRAPLPMPFFFFFNDTATTEIYTLSLHDALPIFRQDGSRKRLLGGRCSGVEKRHLANIGKRVHHLRNTERDACLCERSEEHTSELQSPCNLVCRLLLEKKKTERRSYGAPDAARRC